MDEKRSFFFKQALTDGLVFAIVIILYSIFKKYITLNEEIPFLLNGLTPLVFAIISIVILIVFTKRYRNRHLNGYIGFNVAFSYSLLIIVSSVIMMMMFEYVYLTYIDPDFTAKSIEITQRQTREMLEGNPMFEGPLEKMLSAMSNKVPNAAASAWGTGVANLIWGLIASLITGAVCARKDNTDSVIDQEL